MRSISLVFVAAAAVLAGCAGDNTTSCGGFTAPPRANPGSCDPVGSDPRELVACLKGSGYAGRWSIDFDGLPMYELEVEERCDPAGKDDSALGGGPVHLIGNGRGLTAVAHASGAVELFTQDRTHKWLNHVDMWKDDEHPGYPRQVGGGWSYIIDGGDVRSTRHADLVIGDQADEQTRRLGVGYFETVTRAGELVVRRRVFAPDVDTRAVVAEVSVSNLADNRKEIGLVELWDVNIHQVTGAFADDVSLQNVEEITRRRRDIQSQFDQVASWSAEDRIAVVTSDAKQLPDSVERPGDSSVVDYFPEPVFLAQIDQGTAAEAVWLTAEEIWGASTSRKKPGSLAKKSDASTRTVELDGAGAPAVLALRVPMELPPGTTVTRRFAFGAALPNQTPQQAADELRSIGVELSAKAAEKWQNSLVWAAFPDKDDSGAIQRELAWSSYYLQAAAGYDGQVERRVVSQAGAMRFFYGVEGAVGDIALLGETLALIDPGLAKDTLAFALATQHGMESPTQARFPYAETGIDDYVDVQGQTLRSDAYFLIPAAIAQYLAFTRDTDFLDQPVGYWPRVLREFAGVSRHLEGILQFVNGSLGTGAKGLVAMGSGDYTDGLLDESPVLATASGSSSTVNAMLAAQRFDILADQLETDFSDLADGYRAIWNDQVGQLDSSFSGSYYYRGFTDNGSPLLDEFVFALPQALAILSKLIVGQNARDLLGVFETDLDTEVGVAADTGFDADDRLVPFGHVRPAISAWVAQAAAKADADRGWPFFLSAMSWPRVMNYPNLWYGIWTGPELYVGSGAKAGKAGKALATAFGEQPGLNIHVHAAPIRALLGVLGITPTATGIRIEPHVPGETFHVIFPQLELQGTPTSLSGSISVTGNEAMVLQVVVPSGLRATALHVVVNGQGIGDFLQDGNEVEIELPLTPGAPVTWSVTAGS